MKREWTELEFADWTLLASGVGQNWAFEMLYDDQFMSD